MTNEEWRAFFFAAIDILGEGGYRSVDTPSWCSWTTFPKLSIDAGYWTMGLPRRADILETYIADGGIWGQPFSYSELAHIVLPREFYWETHPGPAFQCGSRDQDIDALSVKLDSIGIKHRKTELILEIKLY